MHDVSFVKRKARRMQAVQTSHREHTSSEAFSKQPEAFLKNSFAVCELLTKKPCAKLPSSLSDCTWLKLNEVVASS